MPQFSCRLDVQIKGGEKLSKEMVVSADYFNFDMEQDIKLVKKVTEEAGLGQEKTDKLIAILKDFDKADSVKNLIELLGQCP